MELNLLTSKYLIAEEKTDGHSPMKFLCSDDQIYYCKYRVTPKKEETDFLVYEIICHYLLKHFNIPTPEIALVELTKNSFDPRQLIRNKFYAKPGVITFGSKIITPSFLVNETQLVDSKTDFNRFSNPSDLIKIALFDLWVGNTDRGREGNFNLLVSTVNRKSIYYAFDNAFSFFGENGLRVFNPKFTITTGDKLLNTNYFRSIVKYIPIHERIEIVKNELSLYDDEAFITIVTKAFNLIPGLWNIPPGLLPRMIKFLSDRSRLKLIEQLVVSSLSTF